LALGSYKTWVVQWSDTKEWFISGEGDGSDNEFKSLAAAKKAAKALLVTRVRRVYEATKAAMLAAGEAL
jgi:hypothetical protein